MNPWPLGTHGEENPESFDPEDLVDYAEILKSSGAMYNVSRQLNEPEGE